MSCQSTSDVDLSSIDLATAPPEIEIRRLLDDRTIVPTDTQDQTIGPALRLSGEQLEHVALSTGQEVPHVTDDVQRLHRSAVPCSPLTRLPPEILAHVFQYYVVREIGLTPVPAQGPLRLAKVCKLWRAAVESDPHLWTSIHFYFSESHQNREEDVSRFKPVFDLHLKRSGALPISLTFTDHRIYHPATEDLISLLVDQLRTHACRWKRISLHLLSGYFPLLFTFTPCNLFSLEHLHISGDVHRHGRVITPLCLNLESAPKLKSFTYSGPGRSMNDRLYLHWESLAEVSFEFAPHHGTSLTLFRQFTHLAQCQNITTYSVGIDRHSWQPPNAITLPCLQTLRVRRLSPDSHAGTAIDPLILPQLQTLEIDASFLVGWNQRWHDRTFSDLLARSGCTLRHLSIQDVDFPNDELVRCLRLSRSLASFRFIPCPRSQNIVDVIRKLDISYTRVGHQTRTPGHSQGRIGGDGPLVPRLREITLASSIEGHLDLMMKMFRSRQGACAHAAGISALQRVEVVFFDMWHDTGVDRVSVPGTRLGRLASFRVELARWVSENDGRNGEEDEDKLQASVVVDSPYLPEYIEVQNS